MSRTAFLLCVPSLLLAQGLVRPIWVNVTPEQSGRIYATGLAQVRGAEADALRQAQANARAEVLTRLRAQVKSTTDLKTASTVNRSTGGPATATSRQDLSQDTRIQTAAADLPGLVVEETWVDRSGSTAHALAYLDVAVAERELRRRFEVLRSSYNGVEPGGTPRERLRRLQSMKGLAQEGVVLDDLAGLLSAAGGEAALRQDVGRMRKRIETALDGLRASLSFGIAGEASHASPDIAALVRDAVLRQGLGWSAREPEFTLVLGEQTSKARAGATYTTERRWWRFQADDTFIVARGALDITLQDRAGTAYERTTLEAKGVGTTEFQAERNLLKDIKEKLGKTLDQWLDELVR